MCIRDSIKNEQGRLSEEEIQRMLREAEENAESDKLAKEKIDARQQLDNYIYSVKSSMTDAEKLKGKLSSDDEQTLEDAIKDGQSFLDSNTDAEKEEYDDKRKEIEGICDPIIKSGMDAKGGDDAEEEEEFSDDGL